jgi:hypothetical protein
LLALSTKEDILSREFNAVCLGCAWHPGRIAGLVPHGVNNDLGFGRLVENDVRVGWRRQAANGGIIHTDANVRP